MEERLGIYCSYCERRLPVSLAVEHISPKSLDPDREPDWSNFLLGCTNCNSVKLNQPTNDDDFLWPDRDNTFRAFTYSAGGFVEISRQVPDRLRPKARALMDIVGLDRHSKKGWPRPARRDKRWEQRESTWRLAEEYRGKIESFSAEGRRLAVALIRDLALGYGFFSVWLTVFRGNPDICHAIWTGFIGTAEDCFDGNGAAVRRSTGRL